MFIPDAANDPSLASIKATLDLRNVRSIVVVPIRWEGSMIGAIFLRTERDADPFSEADVRFCQTVASLTAKALRNAHRFESLLHSQEDVGIAQRKAELQRVALVGFMRRLLDRYARGEEQPGPRRAAKAADDELERLLPCHAGLDRSQGLSAPADHRLAGAARPSSLPAPQASYDYYVSTAPHFRSR